jgi:hypothetical protein
MKNRIGLIISILFMAGGWVGIPATRAAEPKTGQSMEIVSVAADGWTFVKKPSGARFVPFGCNMIFHYPLPKNEGLNQGLNILVQPKWDPATVRKVFAGASSLHMNVMKVFLPSSSVLPDPQTGGKVELAKMDPPLLERLDTLFQIARENRIYIVLTFAEWGVGGLHWWQDGGTFIGRSDEAGAPIDSRAVLAGFWKQIASRCKNEPALFSYNLAVEFLMPQANWGAGKGTEWKNLSVLNDRWGLPAWQAWLKETHGNIAAINKAWGTHYEAIGKIPQPEFIWDGNKVAYTLPQAMLADYNSFREYVTYAFFKNQVDAIRSEDPRHMITCGMHPAQALGSWQGAAWNDNGITFHELDLFDYTTTHLYTGGSDYKPGVDPNGIHGSIIGARLAYAGRPVIIEEMGHIVKDRKETTRETIRQLEALVPHASGFMLWFLTDFDKDTPYGPLNPDLTLNEFGREWKKLVEPQGALINPPTRRDPAAKVVNVSRLEGLAPVQQTESTKLMNGWDKYPQPVDLKMPPNPTLERLRHKASANPKAR